MTSFAKARKIPQGCKEAEKQKGEAGEMSEWEQLHRKAKQLEGRLERQIQKYSSLAQRINADLLCDEENPLLDSKEEQELGLTIETDLLQLSECIERMREAAAKDGNMQHEALVKRYREIHFDYNSEFKTTTTSIQRKRETAELFASSRTGRDAEDDDSDMGRLLRERSSLAASMRSIQDVVGQAFAVRDSLNSSRRIFQNAGNTLSGLTGNVPSIDRLIEGLQKKKTRDNMIVAVVVGLCICFLLWYVFLR